MDDGGEHLFAGARLAVDQDRGIVAGYFQGLAQRGLGERTVENVTGGTDLDAFLGQGGIVGPDVIFERGISAVGRKKFLGFRKFPQQGQREGGVIAHEAGIWNDRQFFAHALGRQGGQLVVAAQCGKKYRAALAALLRADSSVPGLLTQLITTSK